MIGNYKIKLDGFGPALPRETNRDLSRGGELGLERRSSEPIIRIWKLSTLSWKL